MGFNFLGDEFRRVRMPPSALADDITQDRGRAELNRLKLNQHVDLTRDQRIVLREMLDHVDSETENITNPARRERMIMQSIDGMIDRYLEYTPDRVRADNDQNWLRSMERYRGDCEDYAILKYKIARASGIPAEDLAIAYLDVLPDERGGAHEILLYRDPNNRWFVVNNDAPNDGELVPADQYFRTRSAPYTLYNEDGAFYNPDFNTTRVDYINNSTPTGVTAGR